MTQFDYDTMGVLPIELFCRGKLTDKPLALPHLHFLNYQTKGELGEHSFMDEVVPSVWEALGFHSPVP